MRKLEKFVRESPGLLLILAGIVLIFGNIWHSAVGAAADGRKERDSTEQSREKQGEGRWPDARELAGTILLVGSSSMEKYAAALAESFMESYPGVAVTIQFTGSSAGIAAVTGGSADIGMSSRYLKAEEKEAGAVEHIVGYDGIVLCAHPANRISGLTGEQLSGLYTGEIADWSELGGSALPVVPIGREAGSGTRNAFEEFLGLADRCTYANELDSMGAVAARIEATPGAVGYVSLEAADRMRGKAEILALDGAEPSMENIRNGSYPLYRPFIMVTKGEEGKKNELIRAWFAYACSEDGVGIAEMMRIVAVP